MQAQVLVWLVGEKLIMTAREEKTKSSKMGLVVVMMAATTS